MEFRVDAQFYYKNLAQKTQRKPHCHAVAHVLCVFPWTIFRFWETIGICFSKGKYFMADRAHHLLFFFMLRVSKLGGRYRERQWFCQKIWDRKHMKSTDRRIFHFIGGVIEKHTPRSGGLPLLRPKKPQSKSVRKRSSPNAFSLSNILGASLFSIWVCV